MLTEKDSCKEQLQDILDFYEFCKTKNKNFIRITTNENQDGIKIINHIKEMINIYTDKEEFLKDAGKIFDLVKDDIK
jgi:hypothetical protein